MSHSLEARHRVLAEAMVRFVRQQPESNGPTVALAVFGALEASAHRWLRESLKNERRLVRWVHGCPSEDERIRCRSAWGELADVIGLRVVTFERDLASQGFESGTFDLIALVEPQSFHGFDDLVFSKLKPLLKRNGILLAEAPRTLAMRVGDVAVDLKAALRKAGFNGIQTRPIVGETGHEPDREFVLAISDGRFLVPVKAVPEPLSSGPQEKVFPSAQHDQAPVSEPRTEGSGDPSLARAVQELITNMLGRLLRIEPRDLDETAAFSEFGVDSIAGVAFTKELNRTLRTDLKPTILFDYGSIARLTEYVAPTGSSGGADGGSNGGGTRGAPVPSDANGDAQGNAGPGGSACAGSRRRSRVIRGST